MCGETENLVLEQHIFSPNHNSTVVKYYHPYNEGVYSKMNLNKMTVEDIQVSGKKVLVRCDFNVPLDADKNITDETRINAALPTIKYLLDNNAAVVLCSHLGRPKGEFNMKYSLAPVAKRLSEKLGFEVKLAKDVIGEDAKKLAAEVEPGKAILLENVRFHAE